MTDQTLPLPPFPPTSTPKNWAPCSISSLFLFHVFGNFMTSKVTGTQLSWAFFCRKSLENRTESKPVQYHRKYLKKKWCNILSRKCISHSWGRAMNDIRWTILKTKTKCTVTLSASRPLVCSTFVPCSLLLHEPLWHPVGYGCTYNC